MRVLYAILLVTIAHAASGAIVSGVAASQHGVRCAAFGGHLLSAGDRVTLIAPDAPGVPEWSAVVTVQREVATCVPLEHVEMDGPYYELSEPAGADALWIAIAVPGAPPIRKTKEGFTADLDGDLPPETFAICSSMEGVHLTIWSGPPRRGERRSHVYFYVGYDLEETCSDVETEDRARLEKN